MEDLDMIALHIDKLKNAYGRNQHGFVRALCRKTLARLIFKYNTLANYMVYHPYNWW